MVALAGSGDISAVHGGSRTTRMGEPGRRGLEKWKQQVKIMTTRITVIRRFATRYSEKSLQCGIAPGLATASPQLISTALDLLEKSITSEGSKTRNFSTGAHFSPNAPIQDAPNQKVKLGTSEKKIGEGFLSKTGDVFSGHLALSTIQIVLVWLLTSKVLEEADLLEEAFGLIIITVISLDSRQEGTTATYNPVGRTVLKKLLLLLYFSTSATSGVYAQDDSEDGKREYPNEPLDPVYNVQLAAWTFVVGVFIILFFAERNNHRRIVVQATAAAPPAVAVPANPIVAAAPPAVAVPANPIVAAAPPAVPAPAIPIGFFNVMDALNDNPNAPRRSDGNFDILPSLQLD